MCLILKRIICEFSKRAYQPKKNDSDRYRTGFNLLADAMGLSKETIIEKRSHLSSLMSVVAAEYPTLGREDVLKRIIEDNKPDFEKQRIQRGLVSDEEIRSIMPHIYNVVQISNGEQVSAYSAYYAPQRMGDVRPPVGKQPQLKIVK